jgi:farnesyl diphosphate synthase
MTLERAIVTARERVEQALDALLPAEGRHPARLHAAMRYAALGGGKRLRPLLVYAAGEAVGAPVERLDAPACAVELIHCYSLVHDDLPLMDDDDLRRGRPTCHRAFDDATALLVGDALQSLAFQALSGDVGDGDAQRRLSMVNVLATAAGSRGMAGGQAIDLAAVGQQLTEAELQDMHIHKTGALIRASVRLGALSAPLVEAAALERLDHYGKCIGLAFQVQDDVLDVTGDTHVTGKAQGADARLSKPTYPALMGLDGARQFAAGLCEDALASLAGFDRRADTLRAIARYIVDRDH